MAKFEIPREKIARFCKENRITRPSPRAGEGRGGGCIFTVNYRARHPNKTAKVKGVKRLRGKK